MDERMRRIGRAKSLRLIDLRRVGASDLEIAELVARGSVSPGDSSDWDDVLASAASEPIGSGSPLLAIMLGAMVNARPQREVAAFVRSLYGLTRLPPGAGDAYWIGRRLRKRYLLAQADQRNVTTSDPEVAARWISATLEYLQQGRRSRLLTPYDVAKCLRRAIAKPPGEDRSITGGTVRYTQWRSTTTVLTVVRSNALLAIDLWGTSAKEGSAHQPWHAARADGAAEWIATDMPGLLISVPTAAAVAGILEAA